MHRRKFTVGHRHCATQDAQQLSEVVVVGYGTVEKKDLTGSVAVIDNDQLVQRGRLESAFEAMQGQVAGVDISNASGRAGSGFNIQIRGQQSIEGGRPLYVVDGVITDGIEFLESAGHRTDRHSQGCILDSDLRIAWRVRCRACYYETGIQRTNVPSFPMTGTTACGRWHDFSNSWTATSG